MTYKLLWYLFKNLNLIDVAQLSSDDNVLLQLMQPDIMFSHQNVADRQQTEEGEQNFLIQTQISERKSTELHASNLFFIPGTLTLCFNKYVSLKHFHKTFYSL